MNQENQQRGLSMTYQEAIEFLFPLHRFGMKMNLENITALCKYLGHPERRLGTVVHIAGTNGKGSTAAFIASICQEAGLKTGLYTSPHVEHFAERIRINGQMIAEDYVADFVAGVKHKVQEYGATFFEVTTAMAFQYFAEEALDVAVIEVGMGGRLDATNVVLPTYCLITPIDYDHQEWLGNSIEEIATEKAGIIKPGAKTIVARQRLEAMEVLVATAKERKSPITIAPVVAQAQIAPSPLGELAMHLRTQTRDYFGLRTPLWGAYQVENLRLATLCAESMNLNERTIREGIRNVLRNTGHRARLEILSRSPLVILDVSHNPNGMEHTVETLLRHRSEFERLHVVFGAMKDKDLRGLLIPLLRIASNFYLAAPQTERAARVENLAALLTGTACTYHTCESVAHAIQMAKEDMQEKDALLITGSFYVSGQAVRALNANKMSEKVVT
ncbi:MAG: bifunctional folylpolyglutamate synthase/dihydrofolate synthase [Candidatus Thermochlorobacter aerophilum]|uniref:Dihydrofolate synthase/folylpolyglutamate synthase n=1 Tax=Candidatus Thermochlorobacter aerophilus TaxID=1868324 RepID=A0A395LZ89_9BACT|nr:MAG: bifunctional folylpolyglutamate synthase/dihydrofolate synthase [Candidatus Thermochlorobacter aerophilum]